MADEVLRFLASKSDDGVDALTQLCAHVREDLTIGEGPVSQTIKAIDRNIDPRLKKHLDKLRGQFRERSRAESVRDEWDIVQQSEV